VVLSLEGSSRENESGCRSEVRERRKDIDVSAQGAAKGMPYDTRTASTRGDI